MDAQSSVFDYDDFEQYLLEAAKFDRAPADLPARVGVALGLSVPIVMASGMASVLPTTTSLAAGSGVAKASAGTASKGLFAAVKSALGVGSSTLWSTAGKGVAVGVLSGAALVGAGQAVNRVVDGGNSVAATQMQRADVASPKPASAALQRAGLRSDSADTMPPPPMANDSEDDSAKPRDIGDSASTDAPGRHQLAYAGGFAAPAGLAEGAAEPDGTPVRRRPRPIFPEKTSAVARYPLVYDDVSALYDTPKKQPAGSASIQPPAPPVESSPQLDPTELMVLRSKTITQSRTLLSQSRAERALLELDKFRKRVGDRSFGVDELLLHIEALAALGRAKEAQAEVTIVERLAPNSAALRQAQLLARSRFVR